MVPVMTVDKFERFFRAAAGLDVDKKDLKRYSDFVDHKIYDLLLRGKAADPFTIVSHGVLLETVVLSLVAGFAMVVLGLLFGSKAKSVRGAQAITAVVVFPVIFGVQALAFVVVRESAWIAWSIMLGFAVAIVVSVGLSARIWNREEALVSSG